MKSKCIKSKAPLNKPLKKLLCSNSIHCDLQLYNDKRKEATAEWGRIMQHAALQLLQKCSQNSWLNELFSRYIFSGLKYPAGLTKNIKWKERNEMKLDWIWVCWFLQMQQTMISILVELKYIKVFKVAILMNWNRSFVFHFCLLLLCNQLIWLISPTLLLIHIKHCWGDLKVETGLYNFSG